MSLSEKENLQVQLWEFLRYHPFLCRVKALVNNLVKVPALYQEISHLFSSFQNSGFSGLKSIIFYGTYVKETC